jgi:hypothetical protein
MSITVRHALAEETELYTDFVTWALSYRLGEDHKSLNILVNFTNDVYSRARWAEVFPVRFEEGYPTNFIVNVANHFDIIKCLQLLAHEVTHVVQYVQGDYVAGPDGKVVWQDEEYTENHFDEGFEPWEIEARGYEWSLVETFIKFRGYHTKSWYRPSK